MAGDQIARHNEVTRRRRVPDRLVRVALRAVPLAGPPVQIGNQPGLAARQLVAQHIAKQMLITEPLATAVECFVENVARSERKVLASISSTMGSIARNVEGRHYLYRTSKAALNMVMKSLSIDLRDRGVIAVALCPGWVQTDMGGPDAPMTLSEGGKTSVQLATLPDDGPSGRFFFERRELAW